MGEQFTSREWEIDVEMRDVIGRIVRGPYQDGDWQRLRELTAERSRRMMPALPKGHPHE